jgi:hypothetical protein
MDRCFEASLPQSPRERGKKNLSAVNRSYAVDTRLHARWRHPGAFLFYGTAG